MAVKTARTRVIRRWRKNMDVFDDTEYVDMLNTLSEGSVRRNFNPYTDIDWDSPEFAVIPNDERWILPATDPIGQHPWYQSQPVERQWEGSGAVCAVADGDEARRAKCIVAQH